jgi:predicted MPP superfamily phosphohydrolase
MGRLSVVVVVVAGAACGNVSGNISATRSGDTSNSAQRGSPVDALRAACGDTSPLTTIFERAPYLQHVTSTNATIGWVTAETAAERIAVTAPDGTPVGGADGVLANTSLRSAGDRQLWSSLAGLQPGTTYCYEVDRDDTSMVSRTGFRTAPAADDPAPVRFIAFGDSGGGGSDQYALMEQMYTVPYDLMIHTGDVAYEDGSIGQFEDNVFGVYADLFRNIPFFPASGNHDYHTLGAAPFRDVFDLPGNNEKWYSFDWGRVHFAALDTEEDYATQVAWLDADLAATDRPWKVVYMHRPPYSSGSHGSDTTLRNKLAPVLKSHGVQLVLSGHDHDYERVKPQDGVTYVVTGGGGVGTKSVGKSGFTAFAVDVIHFVYVEVTEDQLTLHAIDASGNEFDSAVVTRS